MVTEGAEPLVASFHGVRGSTPCSCPELQRYGGNTSCVSLETPGREPIVLDIGTGVRLWGQGLLDAPIPRIHVLVSHLHWDHVQGLPFFAPLHIPGNQVEIYGPGENGETMEEAFGRFMAPPFFPIRPDELVGDLSFTDVVETVLAIQDARVVVRDVPHTGRTNGYRVERNGASVAYVSDHQQPAGRPDHVAESVLELCEGVDMLIHDAQYTDEEFEMRADWGHCTVDYAVEVARQAGARNLVLFHHDPAHEDDELDRLLEHATRIGEKAGLRSVIAAAEGMKITVG